MIPRGRRLALAVVCLLGSAALASAQRTDVVVLANGDRMTGEVMNLSRGRLEFKTDNVGTIQIEWDNVMRLDAMRTFEVETSGGDRSLGALSSPRDNTLVVTNLFGSPLELPIAEVIRLAPIRAGFFHRIDGAVNAGLSFAQSSGVATGTAASNIVYRRPAFEVQLQTSSTFTRERDGEDTDRQSYRTTYRRFLRNRWEIDGMIFLDRNEELGFQFRTTVAGLAGRRLVQSNRAYFALGAGLAVGRELPLEGPTTTNVEGLIGLNGAFFTYDGPKTNLDYSFVVFPSFSDTGRVRMEWNSTFNRDIIGDFSVGVLFYDSFDNRPPSGGRKNDAGATVSFGITF